MFLFPDNTPIGEFGRSILVGTQEFADTSTVAPDFIMPSSQVVANTGKVCYKNNPSGPFAVNQCLSYGGINFTGSTEGFGAAAEALPITGTTSLKRVVSFGSNDTSFDPATAAPKNNNNQTGVVQQIASKLAFSVQPRNSVAGAIISPAVEVEVQDASGNLITTATDSITIGIGNNPSGGTLSGTTPVNAVNGVATFPDLSIDKAGTGYTLSASASGLTGATSTAFNIKPAAAVKLAFTVQPSNTVAGVSISPPVQVELLDTFNNRVTTTGIDSITLIIGNNPGGGTLSGTTPVTAVSGVSTFSDLSIDKAGTGYTLSASASGLTGATSAAFTVTAGSPSKAVFTVQPSNTVAGAVISPAVQVEVQDTLGNRVTTASSSILIVIANNPSGGTLSGTTTVSAASGVATFSDLSIDKAGVGYSLETPAPIQGGTGAVSNTFNVTAGAPTKLAFTVQPSNTPAGAPISPVVQVEIQNAFGSRVTNATNSITIAIENNPSGGTLSGTTPVTAVSGVSTFSNLSIDKAGTGYTLAASASGLTVATITAFNIFPVPPPPPPPPTPTPTPAVPGITEWGLIGMAVAFILLLLFGMRRRANVRRGSGPW